MKITHIVKYEITNDVITYDYYGKMGGRREINDVCTEMHQ